MPLAEGVSVVVPHYGDPEQTQELVEALKTQVGAELIQIIVVDDFSPRRFPETEGVRVVRRATNGGFGTAVNAGSVEAVHDRILILNSDLTISATFVNDLLEVVQTLPPAVVSPAIFDESGNYQWVGRRFPRTRYYFMDWLTVLAAFRSTSWWHRVVGHDVRCQPGLVLEADWVIGAAMLIPTAQFRRVGGFDESFFMNCEEIDIQRRLRAEGLISVVAGTVAVVHKGGGSSDPVKRRVWLVQSRLKYAQKWRAHPAGIRVSLTIAAFLNAIWNCQRRIRGKRVHVRKTLSQELEYLWGRK